MSLLANLVVIGSTRRGLLTAIIKDAGWQHGAHDKGFASLTTGSPTRLHLRGKLG
jgi:hypothetical protein